MKSMSRTVLFIPQSSVACVTYSHAFWRFHELTGASEDIKWIFFVDKSTFSLDEIAAKVWERKGALVLVFGTHENGGVSIFFLLNGSGEIYHLHSNIGQCKFQLVVWLLKDLIGRFNNDPGKAAGFRSL